MSLQTRIESLVQRLAAEFKTVYERIGPLGHLTTTDKTDLVSAINDLQSQVDALGGIDDTDTDFIAAFETALA